MYWNVPNNYSLLATKCFLVNLQTFRKSWQPYHYYRLTVSSFETYNRDSKNCLSGWKLTLLNQMSGCWYIILCQWSVKFLPGLAEIWGRQTECPVHQVEFSLSLLIQSSQKVSFRPKTCPETPQNEKNPITFCDQFIPIRVFNGKWRHDQQLVPKSFGFLSFWGNSGPVSGQKLTFCDHCKLFR